MNSSKDQDMEGSNPQEHSSVDEDRPKRGKKEVFAVWRRHWISLSKSLIFVTISIAFLALGLKFKLRLDILLFVIAIILFFAFLSFVSWRFSLIILTSGGLEITTQKGLFKRSVVDVPFESIMNTNYASRGLLQAILGFGTIVIQTQSGDIILEMVGHPSRRHKDIVDSYNKFRGFDEDV